MKVILERVAVKHPCVLLGMFDIEKFNWCKCSKVTWKNATKYFKNNCYKLNNKFVEAKIITKNNLPFVKLDFKNKD